MSMNRGSNIVDPEERDRAGARRNTVETPFKRDADRDFDGQRENSHHTASTSSARNEDQDDTDW